MKTLLITFLILFVSFGTTYSHDTHAGMPTDMYVQDVQQQIAYYQQKVNNGTATDYDRQMLAQLKSRLTQLGR